ncbi:DUF47 domain-containing protein [Alicyclobacillus sendaiensis]|uniref:DUF47 domain-containing protein n=1 Tax=Alicyclobacillus sendaiensis TaxID=192387 RepID=UPI000781C6C1|nr:DUF47 family protein [Alicyclobacillus sendaiensis]
MSKLAQWLRPNESRFFALLEAQARQAQRGVHLLGEIVEKEPGEAELRRYAERMHALEREGDAIRRNVIEELIRSFMTPMDREDIYDLSRSLDDILDYAHTTVQEFLVYAIPFEPAIGEMAEALKEGVDALVEAVAGLGKPGPAVHSAIVRAKKMENRMEELYRESNAKLFLSQDVHHIFRMREVYRHLSNAADRLDRAADMVGSILIKGLG